MSRLTSTAVQALYLGHERLHIGHAFAGRKKWRDVQAKPWAAFVVDDLVGVSPWSPRMLEIRGRVEVLATGVARCELDSTRR